MHSFRKVILSLVCFACAFGAISAIVIVPYTNSEAFYYEDRHLRKQLAGETDYITIGASHCLAGFVSETLDMELGCNSYNLSASMMPMFSLIPMAVMFSRTSSIVLGPRALQIK